MKTTTKENGNEFGFKPIVIELESLDEAKLMFHKLNADTERLEEYAGENYEALVELRQRITQPFFSAFRKELKKNDIILKRNNENSYWGNFMKKKYECQLYFERDIEADTEEEAEEIFKAIVDNEDYLTEYITINKKKWGNKNEIQRWKSRSR